LETANGSSPVEYYLSIKKNDILSFTGKWIELENIRLSEVGQIKKEKDQTFSLIYGR
jgi:hypothetical protein